MLCLRSPGHRQSARRLRQSTATARCSGSRSRLSAPTPPEARRAGATGGRRRVATTDHKAAWDCHAIRYSGRCCAYGPCWRPEGASSSRRTGFPRTTSDPQTFRRQQRMAIHRLPVRAQAFRHPRQCKTGQVGKYARFAGHEKPGVVADQMKTLDLLRRSPTDAPVPRRTVEGSGLPAGDRDPLVVPQGHMAQTATGKAVEPRITTGCDHSIPTHPLVRMSQTNLDIRQVETDRLCFENPMF